MADPLKLDEKMEAAAMRLFNLVHLFEIPLGEDDDYGRWYPDKMLPCCEKIVEPERGNLYSFFTHQRMFKHVAMEFGVSPEALRREVTEPDGVFFKAKRNLMAKHTIEKVKESVLSQLEAAESIERRNTIIEINTATQAELETLPGVGKVIAKRIIAERPYRKVDDLIRVKGIGINTISGEKGIGKKLYADEDGNGEVGAFNRKGKGQVLTPDKKCTIPINLEENNYTRDKEEQIARDIEEDSEKDAVQNEEMKETAGRAAERMMLKSEIEGHLKPFKDAPSFMSVIYPGNDPPNGRHALDAVELVRYNPHLDSEGEIMAVDFWLYWMPIYFDNGRGHVIKFNSITAPQEHIRRFINKEGYQLHLEQILDRQELLKSWQKWQDFRAGDAEYYDDLKERYIKAAKEIANEAK